MCVCVSVVVCVVVSVVVCVCVKGKQGDRSETKENSRYHVSLEACVNVD